MTTSSFYMSQAAHLARSRRAYLLERAERFAAAGDAAQAASLRETAARLDEAARHLESKLVSDWP